uniref:HCLS1 associated protein X-1 n=1 Tax=Sphenodon punctatus TaxID=8508 RepID=A0A8D0GBR6_SPHPU
MLGSFQLEGSLCWQSGRQGRALGPRSGADLSSLFEELPSLAPPTSPPPPGERKRTLRDSMLKFPDHPRRSPEGTDPEGSSVPGKRPWRPFHQVGDVALLPLPHAPLLLADLDSHVFSEGLETILPPTQPRSYFKSVSVTRVVAADGRVEERRTVRDSQGHEETVVTRHTSPGAVEEGQGGPALLRRPQNGHLGSDSSSILEAFFQRWFSSR